MINLYSRYCPICFKHTKVRIGAVDLFSLNCKANSHYWFEIKDNRYVAEKFTYYKDQVGIFNRLGKCEVYIAIDRRRLIINNYVFKTNHYDENFMNNIDLLR